MKLILIFVSNGSNKSFFITYYSIIMENQYLRNCTLSPSYFTLHTEKRYSNLQRVKSVHRDGGLPIGIEGNGEFHRVVVMGHPHSQHRGGWLEISESAKWMMDFNWGHQYPRDLPASPLHWSRIQNLHINRQPLSVQWDVCKAGFIWWASQPECVYRGGLALQYTSKSRH